MIPCPILEKSGLAALNGIYTNNKDLSDHMKAYVLREGKPESNIARTMGGPVVNAEFDQTDNIPSSRTERFSFDQQKVEVQWNLASQIHLQNEIAPGNENVMYNYAVIKPKGFEIRMEGTFRKNISAFNPGTINDYNCFFAICEVWVVKIPSQNNRSVIDIHG